MRSAVPTARAVASVAVATGDTDYAPDGSYMHCETVYVLGFGGTNCFWRHVGP
jgi:hypothetical protein